MRRRTFLKRGGAVTGAALAAPYFFSRTSLAAGNLELLVPGEVSSATEGTFPPFSFRRSDGELDGLEMRIMGEICKNLGLKYKPVVTKWESMLISLQAGHYDIIGNAMGITAERQKQVTFCDGWLESGARLVVPGDSTVASSADAKGKSIGVITASIFVPLVEGWGATAKHYKADVDAMQDCANGRLDGMVTDSVAAAYAIQKSKLPLKLAEGLYSPYQMGWAVKKDKPNFVRAVNETRGKLVASGTVKDLFSDLIGYDPSPAKPTRSIL